MPVRTDTELREVRKKLNKEIDLILIKMEELRNDMNAFFSDSNKNANE